MVIQVHDAKIEGALCELILLLDPTLPDALPRARRILEGVFLAGFDVAVTRFRVQGMFQG